MQNTPTSFLFIFVFSIQLIARINFADDWIRTTDLWCRQVILVFTFLVKPSAVAFLCTKFVLLRTALWGVEVTVRFVPSPMGGTIKHPCLSRMVECGGMLRTYFALLFFFRKTLIWVKKHRPLLKSLSWPYFRFKWIFGWKVGLLNVVQIELGEGHALTGWIWQLEVYSLKPDKEKSVEIGRNSTLSYQRIDLIHKYP